eukprot:scaffold241249_cov34-Tisochrysis_lutea.AAC.1
MNGGREYGGAMGRKGGVDREYYFCKPGNWRHLQYCWYKQVRGTKRSKRRSRVLTSLSLSASDVEFERRAG